MWGAPANPDQMASYHDRRDERWRRREETAARAVSRPRVEPAVRRGRMPRAARAKPRATTDRSHAGKASDHRCERCRTQPRRGCSSRVRARRTAGRLVDESLNLRLHGRLIAAVDLHLAVEPETAILSGGVQRAADLRPSLDLHQLTRPQAERWSRWPAAAGHLLWRERQCRSFDETDPAADLLEDHAGHHPDERQHADVATRQLAEE